MKPLGRPPVADKLAELERQLSALLNIMKQQSDKLDRIEKCFARDRAYESLFDRWPGGVNGR